MKNQTWTFLLLLLLWGGEVGCISSTFHVTKGVHPLLQTLHRVTRLALHENIPQKHLHHRQARDQTFLMSISAHL